MLEDRLRYLEYRAGVHIGNFACLRVGRELNRVHFKSTVVVQLETVTSIVSLDHESQIGIFFHVEMNMYPMVL